MEPRNALLTNVVTPEISSNPATTNTTDDGEDVGFLGSTAFNAVFTENHEHISHFSATSDGENRPRGIQLHEQIMAARKIALQRCTGDALFVLEVLRDFPHLVKIVSQWRSMDWCCSLIGQWVKECQASVQQDLFEKYHLSVNDPAHAQAAVDMLHANTRMPLKMPEDVRYRDFISYYAGSRLRWEVVGVFLTACGLGLQMMFAGSDALEFFGRSEVDKQRLMHRLLDASDICLSFCDQANHHTDLSFWLTIENTTYSSQVLGDAHYTVWRKLGDLSTAIFARGLHGLRETPTQSFWLKEMRRRGVAYAYGLDKTLSTFVGRPPRISKRYCNVSVPLDLEYDELALESDELAQACAHLDSAGWNMQPRSSRDRVTSYHRIWIRAALLREDVLELCLGPPQHDLREKAQFLITESKQLYESMPTPLKHSPEIILKYGSEPAFEIVQEYLDSRYNEFMLERTLVRRLEKNPTRLVILSHQILAAVIEARNMRGVLPTGACLSWIVVLQGLPAAAVLALELLQLNVRAVSHARIKQDLCVFISCLGAVHVPGEGNYIVADQGRKTLQHIMDKVFATEIPRMEPGHQGGIRQQGHQQQQHQQGAGEGMVGGVGQQLQQQGPAMTTTGLADDLGVYDFSWLDAGHFDQGFWDSLNSMELGGGN